MCTISISRYYEEITMVVLDDRGFGSGVDSGVFNSLENVFW